MTPELSNTSASARPSPMATDGNVGVERLSMDVSRVIAIIVAVLGAGLWFNTRLSTIDKRLERIEGIISGGVKRSELRLWIANLRSRNGGTLVIPDFEVLDE